jgi:hypothetical protein
LWDRLDYGKHHWIGYSTCSIDELRQCIFDRRLSFRLSARIASKELLVELLMKADLERTFTKLLDLPPELVTRICEFYVSDFDREEVLWKPTQPPLARTCTFLRKTVLPIFYSKCKFAVQGETNDMFRNSEAILTTPSSDMISRIPSEYMRHLRKFRVFFHDIEDIWGRPWEKYGPKEQMYVDVEIESEYPLGCAFQRCTAVAMRGDKDTPDYMGELRARFNELGMRFSEWRTCLMLTAFS